MVVSALQAGVTLDGLLGWGILLFGIVSVVATLGMFLHLMLEVDRWANGSDEAD